MILLLAAYFNCEARNNDTIPPRTIPDTNTQKIIDPLQSYLDRQQTGIDQDAMVRNMDSIMRYQKEQRAKQKRAAIIRIAFGAAMLVLLVVGLSRRRKK